MITNALLVANVFSGPLSAGNLAWIKETFPHGRAFTASKPVPLTAGRNSMIRDVIFPQLAHYGRCIEWCYFIDNDVTVTTPGVERFMGCHSADVVSCWCQMGKPDAWDDPTAFHDHFWKCRPAVLYTIKPPWFSFNLSDDGCDLLGCECMTFRERVIQSGHTLAWAGQCSHAEARSWL